MLYVLMCLCGGELALITARNDRRVNGGFGGGCGGTRFTTSNDLFSECLNIGNEFRVVR